MKERIQKLRDSEDFTLVKKAFKGMTGLDIWLDDLDQDDPKTADELASDYYHFLTKDDKFREKCELSHQAMRDSAHGKNVKFADGVTGLIHFLVPLHLDGEEVAFLRCGGFRDSYRGVLKFMNFSEELREQGYDEKAIHGLKEAFDKLPKLHGEDLAEAVDWIAERASKLEEKLKDL